MIGRTLSHYTIEARLGEGGMGEVYLARDTQLGRRVAIKLLSRATAADAESAGRLLREARAASRLNHPNVVTVHEVGRSDGVDFIVMEHVEGRPLRELIVPRGLPIPQVVDLASQMAEAVAAAHAAGIVHRDLKPANVVLTANGRVKVLDFGLARQAPTGDPAAPTRSALATGGTAAGTILGTVGYMSPEQIRGLTADARSDVFSLGVLMYEMLTGRRPFTGETEWDVLSATVNGEAPPLATLRPGTPPALARIVSRAMAVRPEDRYPSAVELATELARVAGPDAPTPGTRRLSRGLVVGAVVGVIAIAVLAWVLVRQSRLQWARETALAEVARATDQGDVIRAFLIGRRAIAIAPDDPRVRLMWANGTTPASIASDPPGATVEIHNFAEGDPHWVALGTTPVSDVRVPAALLRWRLTKPGYDTLEVGQGLDLEFKLVRAGTRPPGMVLVPKGPFELQTTGQTVSLPEFWLDRYEVTNRQFKAFVDAGGYRRRELWTQPFVLDGRTLTWEQAMDRFRDPTGRPGPATWELGTYPEGHAEDPVGGVSWYEAAAYAAWTGRQLPTAYHWYRASGAFGVFSEILSTSNFSGKGPVPVQNSGGLGPFGTYGMAGNVKEWCWNEATAGTHYILGGAWREIAYAFQDEDARPPFTRDPSFGFRCMLQREPLAARLTAPIHSFERDPSTLKPVSDDVYRAYVHLYDYDSTPLETAVERVEETPSWRMERVTVRAAYGSERLPICLFLPKNARPPYQAIVFFPGSNAVTASSSRSPSMRFAEYLIRSGRALAYPIYAGTYERHEPRAYGAAEIRDISIERGKDVRRAIDYLRSRHDIDPTKIAFYGVSLGAQLAPVYLAIEPRFRTGVLFSGGFETWDIPAESDPVNFAPHVRTPVLMVNGREDFDLPYATSQVPLFRALGTAATDKRHVVLEGGHIPLHPELAIRAVLDWLDARLGPVAAAP